MANSDIHREVVVKLPESVYSIRIGSGLLDDADLLRRHLRGSQVLVVTNTTVSGWYLDRVMRAYAGLSCDAVILEDGEQYKNRESLALIHDTLARLHHHRDTTLVALGGGVVGDLTGFAASTWHRGAGFIQIPTTLLAQVDASVGGKTAINLPAGKNLIGTFYQPDAVFCDIDTLETLPLREFRAGIAEVVKYALLQGGALLDMLERLDIPERCNAMPELAWIIAECCAAKASFVERDPREAGIRALLNLGHTAGHALEAATGYTRFLHGEAVAIGMCFAARLSASAGHLPESACHRVEALLTRFGLPIRIPADISHDAILRHLGHDKKIQKGALRWILMRDFGVCFVSSDTGVTDIQAILAMVTEGERA